MTMVDEPLPAAGEPWPARLDRVRRDVLGNAVHQDDPRCFATVPTAGSFAGTMAITLAAGLQLFAGTALEGAGAAEVDSRAAGVRRAAVDRHHNRADRTMGLEHRRS